MPEKTTNLNLPIPLGNENVNRQYFVDLIQAIDIGAVSEEQLAEQVKRLTEGKQDVVRLADNFKAPTAAITDYPQGFSVFYVGGGTGGQGSAWATAAGATETFGWVETVRTGSAGYQTFTEMYSGTDTTATSGNRQFKRNKRDSNSFWQPFERVLDQDDLVAHNGDYTKHTYWGLNPTRLDTVSRTDYGCTVPGLPDTGTVPDGVSVNVPILGNNRSELIYLRINNMTPVFVRRTPTTNFGIGAMKADTVLSVVKLGNYFLARSTAPTGNATAAQVQKGVTFQSASVPEGGIGTLPIAGSTDINIATGDNTILEQYLATLPAGFSFAALSSIRLPNPSAAVIRQQFNVAKMKVSDGTTTITTDLGATGGVVDVTSLSFDVPNKRMVLAFRYVSNGTSYSSSGYLSLSNLDFTKDLILTFSKIAATGSAGLYFSANISWH